MKQIREQGAIGALLDEYEKALSELESVIADLNPEELTCIVDHYTADKDCKSIQTILNHVIKAGYGYVIEIRKSLGEQLAYKQIKSLNSVADYQNELRNMFSYNEQLFEEYPNLILEEHDPAKKIVVNWGQQYDVEQLFEHAIVHVLRHRRQIERFLIKLHKFKNV